MIILDTQVVLRQLLRDHGMRKTCRNRRTGKLRCPGVSDVRFWLTSLDRRYEPLFFAYRGGSELTHLWRLDTSLPLWWHTLLTASAVFLSANRFWQTVQELAFAPASQAPDWLILGNEDFQKVSRRITLCHSLSDGVSHRLLTPAATRVLQSWRGNVFLGVSPLMLQGVPAIRWHVPCTVQAQEFWVVDPNFWPHSVTGGNSLCCCRGVRAAGSYLQVSLPVEVDRLLVGRTLCLRHAALSVPRGLTVAGSVHGSLLDAPALRAEANPRIQVGGDALIGGVIKDATVSVDGHHLLVCGQGLQGTARVFGREDYRVVADPTDRALRRQMAKVEEEIVVSERRAVRTVRLGKAKKVNLE